MLVVGAGEMSEGMAVALGRRGVAEIAVTNRTVERAAALAARVGGRVAPFADLGAAIAEADLVLTSTGAGATVIDVRPVAARGRRPGERPLLIVDIAVPRNVDRAVDTLPDVTRLDLDDLRDLGGTRHRTALRRGRQGPRHRRRGGRAIPRRGHLPAGGAARRPAARAGRGGARRPSSTATPRKLAGLDDDQRDAVEALTRGLVDKLLHEPSVRLKGDAGTPRGERNAAAVRDLFDLG